jgi:uridine phosphorylase
MNDTRDPSIVKARPIKNISLRKIVFMPMDLHFPKFTRLFSEHGFNSHKTPQGRLLLKGRMGIHLGCIGAPAAVLALEPLILSGAGSIMILGFCGALSDRCKIGDAVLITQAISDEGTSRHYISKKKWFSSSRVLVQESEILLNTQNLPYAKGSLVSTDAPYRETPDWLEKFQKLGAECVDMEASAVFALASFYGIEAAALMIVSDELWAGCWKSGFRTPELEKSAEKYFLPFLEREGS